MPCILDLVPRTNIPRWFGHIERSTGWILLVRKLEVSQKRPERQTVEEVVQQDRGRPWHRFTKTPRTSLCGEDDNDDDDIDAYSYFKACVVLPTRLFAILSSMLYVSSPSLECDSGGEDLLGHSYPVVCPRQQPSSPADEKGSVETLQDFNRSISDSTHKSTQVHTLEE